MSTNNHNEAFSGNLLLNLTCTVIESTLINIGIFYRSLLIIR